MTKSEFATWRDELEHGPARFPVATVLAVVTGLAALGVALLWALHR